MMALNKASEFEKDKVRFAQLAKAFSHPGRIAILEILASKEQCMCGNISTILPLAQSTVSQHLKTLKEAGLIKGKITGPSTCYDVDPETVRECCGLFEQFCDKMFATDKACMDEC